MKKIIDLVSSRIFVFALAVLLQLVWLVALAWGMRNISTTVGWVMNILSLFLVLWLVNKKINPSYKLAWTILILVIPVFGAIVYLLFGESRVAKKMTRESEAVLTEIGNYFKEDPRTRSELQDTDRGVSIQSAYIRDYAGFPLHKNTTTKYYPVGDTMFVDMLEEIKKAEHFIFLEYFIIHDGRMWREILQVLEEKVREGVDVRLIYDDMGCVTTLPHRYYKELQKKGIKCAAFNPVRPVPNIILNNRDHRKILVIDGHTGFTGGINLADEYINEDVRFGHWKDTGVMLHGEGVWNLTVMFLQMWAVITHTRSHLPAYGPYIYHPEEFENDGFVQPYGDSPLDNEIVGENVYLNIINQAKRYVYICTPYLIIDNEMMTALCLASKKGVDVRIVTPGIPDKKMVFLLTQSYYEQLLEAGVRIFQYTPGFIHSKSFVCDDEIASVGTINLDYRSLYLHFECAVWMYKSRAVMQVKDDMEDTFPKCREICMKFCRSRNIVVRMTQSILRLFAPML